MNAGWLGRLELEYRHEAGRTWAMHRHEGPLRVLQPLYPEGEAVCHHVIVHPPGGVVGGDRLEVEVRLAAGAAALLTTPGATRWYRSEGAAATQQVRLRLGEGARLEWLPLETLAYDGCEAGNRLQMELAPGSALIGWELLALGLPATGQPWRSGCFSQHIEWPGCWLDAARIAATDRALLDGAAGWAGRRVLATMWCAMGDLPSASAREALLEGAREAIAAAPDGAGFASAGEDAGRSAGAAGAALAGASAVQPRLVVLRALGERVEPLFGLLAAVRAAWRRTLWRAPDTRPRIWRT